MANDSIPQKHCNKCGRTMPLTPEYFNRNRAQKSGYTSICKSCIKKYRDENPEKTKLVTARWNKEHPEKMREYAAKFESKHPGARKEKSKKYYDNHRREEYERFLRDCEKFPEKRAARKAVTYAVATGVLPRVSTLNCAHCGNQAHNYHHSSYAQKDWLDVIPLCVKCHRKVHREDV